VVSRKLCFIEVRQDGSYQEAGNAPYLDYRPTSDAEAQALHPELDASWLRSEEWERTALGFAIRTIVPGHIEEVKRQRLSLIDKVEREVKTRLQKEINHWDHRAQDLMAKERAGKKTRLPARVAQDRANRLADRLQVRLEGLERERTISSRPPEIVGGALIVPIGLVRKYLPKEGTEQHRQSPSAEARAAVEKLAMDAVMASERALGREPRDVSDARGLGYDIESKAPETGELYFVEVKGRAVGEATITMPRSEVLCALNEPEKFRLAIVQVANGQARAPVYVTEFDWGQPGFAQTSSTFSLASLLAQGGDPS
jgi:hypothetical protein